MRHRGLVHHDEFHPLALGYRKRRRVLRPRHIVDRPDVARHVAGQIDRVHTVRLAVSQGRDGPQSALQIQRQCGRWLRRHIWDARNCPGAGRQHDAGLSRCALQNGEHGVGGRPRRHREPNIQPLRHGDREAARGHRLHPEAVDRDQLAVERAQIQVEIAHRRAVDDAQQHAPARLHLDHLRIGERSVVGEERVIGHIVQIGRGVGARSGAHRHARHRHAGRGFAAHPGHLARLPQRRVDFLRRCEAEIVQHQHDLLLVRLVAPIVDDQGRRHQQLFL